MEKFRNIIRWGMACLMTLTFSLLAFWPNLLFRWRDAILWGMAIAIIAYLLTEVLLPRLAEAKAKKKAEEEKKAAEAQAMADTLAALRKQVEELAKNTK